MKCFYYFLGVHEYIKLDELDENFQLQNVICNSVFFLCHKLDKFVLLEVFYLYFLLIDIVICNAGIGRGAEGILKASREDIEVSTKLNVESYLHTLKAIVPGMIKRRKGHVVLMGSLAGLYPQISSVYGGQKGAIHRIAQSLRIELSGSRVKVSEICPGRTKTNFGKSAFKNKDKAKKFMSGFTLLEPRDIADAIMFSLSVRWRSNISTIEISGTEQSPGGVPIIPVKDPILS